MIIIISDEFLCNNDIECPESSIETADQHGYGQHASQDTSQVNMESAADAVPTAAPSTSRNG
jgi:hypothetical protein